MANIKGTVGAGAGGGNRTTAKHIVKQHNAHGKGKMLSTNGMSSKTKLPGKKPANTGNPLFGKKPNATSRPAGD